MYPGSGVVLGCVDSWSLPSFLLWLSELFCLCCVAALKSIPALSFNALIIPILRMMCTISFHTSKIFYWPFQGGGSFVLFLSCFVMLSCTSVCWCLVVTCWERADLLALVCDVYLWRHFPIGILGQVWCLIVLIPDLCPLSYFDRESNLQLLQK